MQSERRPDPALIMLLADPGGHHMVASEARSRRVSITALPRLEGVDPARF